MRFDGIRVHNLGPFGDVELDLTGIDGRVIAVAGSNGAGKSTLLELLAAGLYRTTPTRGKLAELATGRDSYVEVRAVNGASYTIRHTVDGANGKGESLVLDDAGAPLLSSAKVREFDGWAADHLPSPEVFFASVFAAQGSGGFLDMKPGDRKAVLLRTLGIEHLERVAEKAREHERSARQRLEVVQARLADERARRLDVDEAERQLADARARAAEADVALEKARAELARVEEEARKAEDARAAVIAHAQRQQELQRKRMAAAERMNDIGKRIINNRKALGDAERIRAAVAEVETLRADIDAARSRRSDATRDAQAFETESLSWFGRSKDAERRAQSACARIESARHRLAGREAVERAVAELERLGDAVGVAAQEHLAASEAYETIANQTVAGLGERVEGLRRGLQRIVYEPVNVEMAQEIAKGSLDSDDSAARLATELPRLKSEASDRERAARIALDKARSQLSTAEGIAARAPDLDLAQQDLEAAQAEYSTATEEASAHARRSASSRAKADEAAKGMRALSDGAKVSEARLAQVEPIAARAKHLDTAQARIEELAPQHEAATAELYSIEADLEAMGPAPIVPPAPNVEASRFAVRQAERAARDAHAAPPVREHALKLAMESAARAAELGGARAMAEAELADYAKLAADLGRSGLQAYEVDAVGPELTELVNDLLRECVGHRWTVSIETQRNSADGKRVLEGCDVRVIDTERGREASAESLSGGEKVLVGEAVSLALSMLSCRRAGIEGVTLVRDETGAALDPASARGYVAMLRRAADIVGASKVLFVSHSVDVQELADARVLVADGKVEVQS